MGLLGWLTDRFGARPPGNGGGVGDASDADELVLVANVRAFQAPMIEEVLAAGGVVCSVIDEHAASTWEPMRRILVSRADAGSAERLLAEFHSR